jgi:hypothetical protein
LEEKRTTTVLTLVEIYAQVPQLGQRKCFHKILVLSLKLLSQICQLSFGKLPETALCRLPVIGRHLVCLTDLLPAMYEQILESRHSKQG